MPKKQIYSIMLAAAVLVALVLAWPSIIALERHPRIGDWVPNEDPGTLLTVQDHGRNYALGLGRSHFSCDITCTEPLGYEQLTAQVYTETDNVLGPAGEPSLTRVDTTTTEPTATDSLIGFSGFAANGHLQIEIGFSDGLETRTMVAPPLDLRRGVETDWQTLAAVWHLGVLLEWRQTTDHLLLRRSALPDAPQPTWQGGGFRVGEAGCQFADDTQIARLFRARVPSQPEGEQNVQIWLQVADEGIRTIVLVR